MRAVCPCPVSLVVYVPAQGWVPWTCDLTYGVWPKAFLIDSAQDFLLRAMRTNAAHVQALLDAWTDLECTDPFVVVTTKPDSDDEDDNEDEGAYSIQQLQDNAKVMLATLPAMEKCGCIANIDSLMVALQKKLEGFADGWEHLKPQAVCIKGMCQWLVSIF